MEETGVEAEFLCVMGLRENVKFKYGASDLYFGCVLLASDSDIDIQDTREVKMAQWINLKDLTFIDGDEKPSYFLYPTARAYLKEVKL